MKTKNRIWVCPLIVMGLILIFTPDCKKEETAKLAVLSTTPVTDITITTATSGGNITSNGGAEIIAKGVCWSTTVNPSITDDKTIDGVGIAQFVSNLSGLTAGMTYYARAYATNSAGTAYGISWSFTTYNSDAIPDIDGNYYNIVTIGTQTWLAKDLITTRYRNGDPIETTTYGKDISGEATPKYQWAPEDAETHIPAYGRLYTWYAVTDIRNVCPTRSHVPTAKEWQTLSNYCGGDGVAGGELKKKGTDYWREPNRGAKDTYGFSALATGARPYDGKELYIPGTTSGHWWGIDMDAGTHYNRYITSDDIYLGWDFQGVLFYYALAVRCLRDN